MEDVLAGLKAYFTSDLAAMLTTIAAERSVTVPSWKIMETHEVYDRQYPMVEILPGSTEFDYSSQDEPFANEPWADHNVVVLVTQVGSKVEDVQNDLLRYVEAIRRVVLADDTAGERFHDVRIAAALFDDMRQNQEDRQLMQTVGVQLAVRVTT